jgi:protein-S-isoprenylcysteine O-methyltransferase Ste14
LAGIAVLFANVAACIVVLPLFVWYMTRFQIIPEERSMRVKFGTEYSSYQNEVSRWL